MIFRDIKWRTFLPIVSPVIRIGLTKDGAVGQRRIQLIGNAFLIFHTLPSPSQVLCKISRFFLAVIIHGWIITKLDKISIKYHWMNHLHRESSYLCRFCSVFSNYSYHRHLSDINIPWLILTNISQIFPHLEEKAKALGLLCTIEN